jgi:hypothetical protein
MQDGDTMEVVLAAAPVVPGPAQVFTPTAAGALTPTNEPDSVQPSIRHARAASGLGEHVRGVAAAGDLFAAAAVQDLAGSGAVDGVAGGAADVPDAYSAHSDDDEDDASLYCYPPNRGPAAIPTAEAALDAGVPTATLSTGRDDDGGVAGIVDVEADDFAWVDQWIEDGGDAAGFWAAPGEAGPLTGGIWGMPIGGETLADGVVAVGEAIVADEPTSISDLAETDATEVDMEGENLAAVGGSPSFAESMNMGMWWLSYD